MNIVKIYDQFSNVFDKDGTTILHPSSGFTIVKGEFTLKDDSNAFVNSLYEESKTLGSYQDKIIKINEGYAELKISFEDGRLLNRVIYTEST